MGIQFVRRETEDILNRLSMNEGISKAQMIHRALMDYEESKLKQESTQYVSSSTMQLVGNNPKTQEFRPVMTKEALNKRIDYYKKMGYSDTQILERVKNFVIVEG